MFAEYKRLFVTADELALARNKGMKDPCVPSYPKGRMRFLAEDGTTAATVVYAARPEETFGDCGKVLGVTVMVPGKVRRRVYGRALREVFPGGQRPSRMEEPGRP